MGILHLYAFKTETETKNHQSTVERHRETASKSVKKNNKENCYMPFSHKQYTVAFSQKNMTHFLVGTLLNKQTGKALVQAKFLIETSISASPFKRGSYCEPPF